MIRAASSARTEDGQARTPPPASAAEAAASSAPTSVSLRSSAKRVLSLVIHLAQVGGRAGLVVLAAGQPAPPRAAPVSSSCMKYDQPSRRRSRPAACRSPPCRRARRARRAMLGDLQRVGAGGAAAAARAGPWRRCWLRAPGFKGDGVRLARWAAPADAAAARRAAPRTAGVTPLDIAWAPDRCRSSGISVASASEQPAAGGRAALQLEAIDGVEHGLRGCRWAAAPPRPRRRKPRCPGARWRAGR